MSACYYAHSKSAPFYATRFFCRAMIYLKHAKRLVQHAKIAQCYARISYSDAKRYCLNAKKNWQHARILLLGAMIDNKHDYSNCVAHHARNDHKYAPPHFDRRGAKNYRCNAMNACCYAKTNCSYARIV